MSDIIIKKAETDSELAQVFKIREIVFIKGQNVPKEREMDGYDSKANHFLVLIKDIPIGCARVRFYNKGLAKIAKIERVAILDESRNKGLGKMLMAYLVDFCKKQGAKEIDLHSQLHAKEFYLKCGFTPYGKIFVDAGIEHIAMYKTL